MHSTNFHFYPDKNYLYSKPVKGLRGYGVGYGFAFNGQEKDDEVAGAPLSVVCSKVITEVLRILNEKEFVTLTFNPAALAKN